MLSKYTLNNIKPLLFNDFLPYLFLFLPSIDASPISKRLTTIPDSGVATFQRDHISEVVSEAMEEWCSGVEHRLWGFQYSDSSFLQFSLLYDGDISSLVSALSFCMNGEQ